MLKLIAIAAFFFIAVCFPAYLIFDQAETHLGRRRVLKFITAILCGILAFFAGLISKLLLPEFIFEENFARVSIFIGTPVLSGLILHQYARFRLARNPEIYAGANIVRFANFANGFIFCFVFNLVRLLVVSR